MLDSLTSLGQLLLVIVGFGSVIFIHELGHFLAAKWAGIRVHEFAIGFGKPICSWRQGVGFRMGSTRPGVNPAAPIPAGEGETEYRLNWLPFGGYVKMLGQDDLHPTESADPRSYTQKPVWKRMVVVSAGVVMNLILAAVLFLIVFMVGMPAPSPTIGQVAEGSPAAQATPVSDPGVEPGLRTGDVVLEISGRRAMSFADLSLAAAMAERGQKIPVTVQRAGHDAPIEFTMVPTQSKETHLLELGVGSALSTSLVPAPKDNPLGLALYTLHRQRAGIEKLPDGSRLTSVNGAPVTLADQLIEKIDQGHGEPVRAVFTAPDGGVTNVVITPEPTLDTGTYKDAKNDKRKFHHLLGLRPAAVVGACSEHALAQGLRPGDVIARIDDRVWPSIDRFIETVSAKPGDKVEIRVLRDGAYTELTAKIDRQGRIGMFFDETPSAMPPIVVRMPSNTESEHAEAPDLAPGSRILSVNNNPVASFADVERALLAAPAGPVELVVRLPIGPDPAQAPTQTVAWDLSSQDREHLASLGWSSPIDSFLFEYDQTLLKADGPVDALVMGVSETRRYVIMTYLTFVRLAQGTVKVEHIKGPVGIAHFGTKVVEQGFLNLLFFLGVISANLAVINFLPLPIVDGGLFVFLLVESVTRRPVSVAIQSAATLAGVVLIGAVFLFVTFNDIRTLFGS
ncbi:MAG: site-2 protease family protein [Phycisphaeraceae bacterium]|nr:site-2 protease family protein [Phycisphaeraceae bacterium]